MQFVPNFGRTVPAVAKVIFHLVVEVVLEVVEWNTVQIVPNFAHIQVIPKAGSQRIFKAKHQSLKVMKSNTFLPLSWIRRGGQL